MKTGDFRALASNCTLQMKCRQSDLYLQYALSEKEL
jgi:hypothetical protein